MFWSKTVRSYSHAVYLCSQLNFVLSRHDLLCVSFAGPTGTHLWCCCWYLSRSAAAANGFHSALLIINVAALGLSRVHEVRCMCNVAAQRLLDVVLSCSTLPVNELPRDLDLRVRPPSHARARDRRARKRLPYMPSSERGRDAHLLSATQAYMRAQLTLHSGPARGERTPR